MFMFMSHKTQFTKTNVQDLVGLRIVECAHDCIKITNKNPLDPEYVSRLTKFHLFITVF